MSGKYIKRLYSVLCFENEIVFKVLFTANVYACVLIKCAVLRSKA